MKKIQILLLIIILFGCTRNDSSVPTVSGKTINPDGLFNEKVWSRSRIFALPSASTLHLLQSDDDVFLAIEFDDEFGKYVDVYISNDSMGTINLHASMQLGERILTDNWNDTIPLWNWGNNQGWIANTIRYKENNETLLLMESIEPYDAFEFVISKSKLRQNSLFIRLEIRDFTGKVEDHIYPPLSKREDTSSWLQVNL
jgi:hypothetical protein